MKRLSVISLVLVVAGCGSDVTDPPSARERITPAMREACSTSANSEIAANITAFDTLWEEGFSRREALQSGAEACLPENNPVMGLFCGLDLFCVEQLRSVCNACNAAVIDAVFR